jgi:hypothetical protein
MPRTFENSEWCNRFFVQYTSWLWLCHTGTMCKETGKRSYLRTISLWPLGPEGFNGATHVTYNASWHTHTHTHTISLSLSGTNILNTNNGAAEDNLRDVRHTVMVSSFISRFSGTSLVLSIKQSNNFWQKNQYFVWRSRVLCHLGLSKFTRALLNTSSNINENFTWVSNSADAVFKTFPFRAHT